MPYNLKVSMLNATVFLFVFVLVDGFSVELDLMTGDDDIVVTLCKKFHLLLGIQDDVVNGVDFDECLSIHLNVICDGLKKQLLVG